MEALINNLKYITLPKFQLPTFDGHILKWCLFRDTFAALVHYNPQLSSIEKFHYLLSSVSGTATGVVRSLSLTAKNNDIVYGTICKIGQQQASTYSRTFRRYISF